MGRYVRIGLFVGLSLTAVTIYIMRAAENIGSAGTYTITAFVDDASGLVLDSNITLAGVRVGRLANIELENGRAKLTLEIDNNVELYEGAAVETVTESMLGSSTVTINPGPIGAGAGAPLGDGSTVRTIEGGATLASTLGSAGNLADGATNLVEELTTLLQEDGLSEDIAATVAALRETAEISRDLLEQNLVLARATMENVRRFSDEQLVTLAAILESTAQLTARLDQFVANSEGTVTAGIEDLSESAALARAALDDVAQLTSMVREGEGNVGRLLNDDQLYEQTVRVVDGAEGIINRINSLQVQIEFASEYQALSSDVRTNAGVRLIPRSNADKYYRLGVVVAPDPTSEETTTQTVETVGATTTTTTRMETVQQNELLFDAQLARSWGPLTVRAGVLASSAGVGVDLQPFGPLVLSAELSQFDQSSPYLRGGATVLPLFDPESNSPLRWLYLSGGVDDILGDLDYYFGAGLRFTDNDLVGAIGLVPLQ